MLLHQEAGDLVDVVAMGGAKSEPHPRLMTHLLGASRWLVALDRDGAGDQGAEWWSDFSARVRRVRPLQGNDLTEFHLSGGNLRLWVSHHLDQVGAVVEPESPVSDAPSAPSATSPQTIDERAHWLYNNCDGSREWAESWADLAREAGWPCYGMTWSEWVEDVAPSLQPMVQPQPGSASDSTEGPSGCRVAGRDNDEQTSGERGQDDGRPTEPCRPFGMGEHRRFWEGPGGWICAACHPPPHPDVTTWELPPTEPR
jgi:hypothetical protein